MDISIQAPPQPVVPPVAPPVTEPPVSNVPSTSPPNIPHSNQAFTSESSEALVKDSSLILYSLNKSWPIRLFL
jgi:hypothetical protein